MLSVSKTNIFLTHLTRLLVFSKWQHGHNKNCLIIFYLLTFPYRQKIFYLNLWFLDFFDLINQMTISSYFCFDIHFWNYFYITLINTTQYFTRKSVSSTSSHKFAIAIDDNFFKGKKFWLNHGETKVTSIFYSQTSFL